MGCGSEVVRETEEVLEDGERGGVVGGELQGEIDALAGLGIFEAGEMLAKIHE